MSLPRKGVRGECGSGGVSLWAGSGAGPLSGVAIRGDMVMKKYVVMAKDGVALFDSVPEWALQPYYLVAAVDMPEEKEEDDIDSWPIPTNEDARWRPKVMVRDCPGGEWIGPEVLVYVNEDGITEWPFMDSDGIKWTYCRFSPGEKARCEALSARITPPAPF
jgi:hypothetical protein